MEHILNYYNVIIMPPPLHCKILRTDFRNEYSSIPVFIDFSLVSLGYNW